MSQSTENPQSPTQAAHARLEEFSSDPIAMVEDIAKEQRMQEMNSWAEGIGAHTERLAARHHVASVAITESAKDGAVDLDKARYELKNVPNFRTGVRVEKNGDVDVNHAYPFSGDAPAGNSKSYRSPANFKK